MNKIKYIQKFIASFLAVFALLIFSADTHADITEIEDYEIDMEDLMTFYYDILTGEVVDLAISETASATDVDEDDVEDIVDLKYPDDDFIGQFDSLPEADAKIFEVRTAYAYWRDRFTMELIWKAETIPYSIIANDDTEDYEEDWIPTLDEIAYYVHEEDPTFLDDVDQMIDDLSDIHSETYLLNKMATSWWDWNFCKVPTVIEPIGIAFGRVNTYDPPTNSADLEEWVEAYLDEFSLKNIFGIIDADVKASAGEIEDDRQDLSNRLDPGYSTNLSRKLSTTGVDLNYVGEKSSEDAIQNEDAIQDRYMTAAREVNFQSVFRTVMRLEEELQAYYNNWENINDTLEDIAIYRDRFIFDCP